MEDIENMMRCRAIFIYNILTTSNEPALFDNTQFNYVLSDFLREYIDSQFAIFNVMFMLTKDDNGNYIVQNDSKWQSIFDRYMNILIRRDEQQLIKMYNKIDSKVLMMLDELTELFYQYLDQNEIYKVKNYGIRS